MEKAEVWLRGPIDNIPALLQPVAHAILQSGEDVEKIMNGFPIEKLWERPAGVASPGFHLQHLAGVLDRLFTYARGEGLSQEQFDYLRQEGSAPTTPFTIRGMVMHFNDQVQKCLQQLERTNEKSLLLSIGVGRQKLPSNVLGLLFHAAEHTQRHTGQLLVTVRVLKA
jgi:uncharacterized damage-inducible protein DinB